MNLGRSSACTSIIVRGLDARCPARPPRFSKLPHLACALGSHSLIAPRLTMAHTKVMGNLQQQVVFGS